MAVAVAVTTTLATGPVEDDLQVTLEVTADSVLPLVGFYPIYNVLWDVKDLWNMLGFNSILAV